MANFVSNSVSNSIPRLAPNAVSNFGLTVRFVFTLLAIVLFTSAVSVALWAHDHMLRRQNALQAHSQLVLRDLAQALETRLSLGLPLSHLPDVERLLDAARLQLPAARSAGVVDEAGRVLFSTDAVDLGDAFSDFKAGWLARDGHAKRGAEEIYWLTVNTDDGALAGAVLLRLPIAVSDQGWPSLAVSLALSAAPALAVLMLLAVAAGVWLARAAGRCPASMAAALDHLRGKPGVLPGVQQGLGGLGAAFPAQDSSTSSSDIPLPAFVALVGERHRQLSDAEQALGQLDEMA